MSLQGVLSQRILPTAIPQPVLEAPDVDRTAWIGGGGGGGGWKSGKGNSNNNALSALTLLAFLFFLNILQNCLRDTFGQNPGMVVMMVTTTTEASARRKREQLEWEQTTHPPLSHWTESQITNQIHNQIQSYWASGKEKAVSDNGMNHNRIEQNPGTYKNTVNNIERYEESIQSDTYIGQQEIKSRISAKLNAVNKSTENYTHNKQYQRESLLKKPVHITSNELTWNQSYSNEKMPQWEKVLGTVFKNSRAYVENKCCGLIGNWTKESMYGVGNVAFFNSLMRHAALWICNKLLTENC